MKANSSGDTPTDLTGNLRQMIAVLETERQALATLQPDALMAVTREKEGLCDILAQPGARPLDEKTRALVETAKSLNDANRRVRNLLAANVAGRLDALGAQRSGRHAYTAQASG
jgi:flagellar biosynthesis/type III secretory pathway chaperone